MPFNFRKSIKIAPGVKINLSKSGVSSTIGKRGASVNVGKRGVRVTTGIPGSCISYSQQLAGASNAPAPRTRRKGITGISATEPDYIQEVGAPVKRRSRRARRISNKAMWIWIGILFVFCFVLVSNMS